MFFELILSCLFVSCATESPNFLLIIVDDLRPSLGCYGDRKAYTPNIDRLAATGAVFKEAYAQQALCAPSRNSFLTGRRPDTLKLYDFYGYWRHAVGNFTTLPQHLKNNGYVTKSVGKVFHPGISSNWSDDFPYSWTEAPFHPYTNKYKNAAVCGKGLKNLVCPVDVSTMPGKTLPDLEIVKEATRFLRSRKGTSTPFFLAVGFEKPHIPLKFPGSYLNLHPIENFNVPEPYDWPRNVNSVAYNPWNDLRRRDDVQDLKLKFPWEKIPENFGASIIQSYYASVSYIDDLVGKLVCHLNAFGMRRNTIITLVSDHGWALGEHAEWAKYSNFDVAVRVPFIISIPGITLGQRTIEQIVELVDLYPTIAELSGFPIPTCKSEESVDTCSEGSSVVPLLNQKSPVEKWKRAAFSQYPRPSVHPKREPNSDEPKLDQIRYMGYTVKTKNYRYTAWLRFNSKSKRPKWKGIVAEELYNHRDDRQEIRNIADHEEYKIIKNTLFRLLQRGWRAALP